MMITAIFTKREDIRGIQTKYQPELVHNKQISLHITFSTHTKKWNELHWLLGLVTFTGVFKYLVLKQW